MKRKQMEYIQKDLKKKMVFIVGPRQVGKTTLAKEIAKSYKNPLYLNYDNLQHREIIYNQSWVSDTDLVIFDEIHKMDGWKNYIKGVFDTKPNNMHILVTGSARLNTKKQTGDSLAGRFYSHRLLPFSLSELNGTEFEGDLNRLLERGGFPEPFLAETLLEAERWRSFYADSLLRKDVLDFADVDNWLAMKQLFEILQSKVGSPISYNNIAQDLGISPITVKRYIEIFEELYLIFIVRPYSRKISRAILKSPKIYFYDYGFVKDEAIRLENFVALSLLKSIWAEKDITGKDKQLFFIRTKEGKEVDFAIVSNNTITQLIEVKVSKTDASGGLVYFAEKYNVPAVQLVYNTDIEKKISRNVELRSMKKYLEKLFM